MASDTIKIRCLEPTLSDGTLYTPDGGQWKDGVYDVEVEWAKGLLSGTAPRRFERWVAPAQPPGNGDGNGNGDS